jgi:hypothetical protein
LQSIILAIDNSRNPYTSGPASDIPEKEFNNMLYDELFGPSGCFAEAGVYPAGDVTIKINPEKQNE